jgi:hypothetical protein
MAPTRKIESASTETAPLASTPFTTRQLGSPLEVLRIFLKLGVSCFGGPIAHAGYFRARRDRSGAGVMGDSPW